MFEEGQFLVLEEEHSLCSKQDVPCVRSRTFLMFEEGHSFCVTKDIPCARRRNSLCLKEDIPCVRSRTFLVLRTRHLLCSNHEKCTCHFLLNSVDRPRIWANRDQIRTIPGMIGQIRQKVAGGFFSCFFLHVFPKPAPKVLRRKLRTESSVPKGSLRKVHVERFTPKGSRRKVHDVEFSERIIFERGHVSVLESRFQEFGSGCH